MHRRQIEVLLLLLQSSPTAAPPAPVPILAVDAAISPRNSTISDNDHNGSSSDGNGGRTNISAKSTTERAQETGTSSNNRRNSNGHSTKEDAVVRMIAYLVLERCSLLADGGYTLQSAAEALYALGEVKSLRGWDAAPGSREKGNPLLRIPSVVGSVGGSESGNDPSANVDSDRGDLPEVTFASGCPELVNFSIRYQL